MKLFGRESGQSWIDLMEWEQFLNETEGQFKQIIEVGTYEGAMSFFLYAQASARGMMFSTCDINKPQNYVPLFSKVSYDEVVWMHKPSSVYFCDGGNKVEECNFFSRWAGKKSAIVVHDYRTEFTDDDIPDEYRPYMIGERTVFLMTNDFLNELEVLNQRRYP